MSESEQPKATPQPAPTVENVPAPITTIKVAQDIPVIFADGVTSQSFGPGISKFYVHRVDSDPHLLTPNKVINMLQVVVPAEGFIKMTAFFEHRLRIMVANNIVSQEAVDQARDFWIKNPGVGISSAT
jgi:hypothetical protein